jgi:signal transduction histidine kinase
MKRLLNITKPSSLSASLTIAFLVFFAPVAFLLFLFQQSQQQDIEFTKRELRGLEYITEVNRAAYAVDNAVYQSEVTGSLNSSLFTSAEQLKRADALFGDQFEAGDSVNMLVNSMVESASNGIMTNGMAGPVNTKIRSLIAQIGDASNLILDPELDSYYLMDMFVIRIPELTSVLSTRAVALEAANAGDSTNVRLSDQGWVETIGTYKVALRQLKDSVASSLRYTTTPSKTAALQTQFSDTAEALERLDAYLRTSINGQQRGFDPKVAATMEWQTRQRLHELSNIAGHNLKVLLKNRITKLETARTQSLLSAGILFAAAMAFIVVLLSMRVTRPLKMLTNVADTFVAGDLSTQTPLQTRGDEVGALARAFERLRVDAKGRLEAEAGRASADAANKAKSAFLAVMSHELRTPLNAVIGYAEILEEDLKDEGLLQHHEDAAKIRSAGRHLLGIINQVLDLSKIEAGSMEIEHIAYCPSTLVREIADMTRPLIETGGNTLAVSAQGLPEAIGDPTRVRQCLFNLVSNAGKFTQNGVVSVEASVDGNMLTFTVKDTGIGMTDAQMAHVFEPFAQADESTTRRFGGTGLGLAITRKLARIMGGDSSVTSRMGIGSTFTLSIALNTREIGGKSVEECALLDVAA